MNNNVKLLQSFYKILNKKFSKTHKRTGVNSDMVFEHNQLVEKLHKPIIRQFEKQKVYSFL